MKFIVIKIMQGMMAEAQKPCKTDERNCSYIMVNKYIRAFCILAVIISVSIFCFMPQYINESVVIAIVLLVISLIILFITLRTLFKRYTLTDSGLSCSVSAGKVISYGELNKAYIECRQNEFDDVLHIDGRKTIPLHLFYGSYDFIRQLEEKADITLERKDTKFAEKPKILPLAAILILGVILFVMKNAS